MISLLAMDICTICKQQDAAMTRYIYIDELGLDVKCSSCLTCYNNHQRNTIIVMILGVLLISLMFLKFS